MAIDSKYESCLKAKLSFKEYVAPRNYSAVRERLRIPEDSFRHTELGAYLQQFEGVEYSKNYVKDLTFKQRKFSIKSNKRKMTLEIDVESGKNLDCDELFNVLNLHEFIITGKEPQKNSSK